MVRCREKKIIVMSVVNKLQTSCPYCPYEFEYRYSDSYGQITMFDKDGFLPANTQNRVLLMA